MSNGKLSARQRELVKPVVEGETIHDLGAGDLSLAHVLIWLGAARVVAIDKQPMPDGADLRIDRVTSYFNHYREPIQTAFVSWPINWADEGLVECVRRASIVIYLGSNMDGSACGATALWEHLSGRIILAHEPERSNTLIVYGPDLVDRELVPEEFAALNTQRMWGYDELYENRE